MPGRRKSLVRGLLAAWFVLVMLAAAAVSGAIVLYGRPGPLPHARAIVVPHGPVSDAGRALQQPGALPAGLLARAGFRAAVRLTRAYGPIHAGEFEFPAYASLRALLLVLRTGQPVQHATTVPEGLTSAQIALLLAKAEALSGPVPVVAEGSVLPQTYDYVLGTTRAALALRMRHAMQAALAGIWAGRDRQAGLTSPAELVVLASMVERETALGPERPLVARVFLNRLRLGMRLQSDPTVAYAATGGLGELRRPLSRADLELDNPYNTYVVPGLPPGPICAPGVASMLAVAHPAASDALYFVANGNGGHAFADTLAEHLQNVGRLRALHGASEAAP